MPETVHVDNLMQTDYIYTRTHDEWDFSDLEGFAPELLPHEMLRLGVFWWKYFGDIPGTGEYPERFEALIKKVSVWVWHPADPERNCFKVDASQSLAIWEEKWWIDPQDPRGWFERYTRTYFWRRSDDDTRQIKRRKNIVRHLWQLKANCDKGDVTCRPRQRQAVLHWSYDSINNY